MEKCAKAQQKRTIRRHKKASFIRQNSKRERLADINLYEFEFLGMNYSLGQNLL